MDQYTRRILGFGVHAGTIDGVALCRMFNRAIRGHRWLPKYLSSDNDPLYKFHQWQANLRILEVTEIKSLPYVPLSHPFVERLIGTLRREYLDHMLFWTTVDLENKLLDFRTYFNHHRTHTSREGRTPDPPAPQPVANLRSFRWQPTVEAYIRHRRLPDLSKIRAGCDIRSTSTKLPGNHSEFLHRSLLRGSHRFTATGCVPTVRLSPLSQLRSAITGESASHVTIRQTQPTMLASVGKIPCATWGARPGGMGVRSSWAVGIAMNARGAMEMILGSLAASGRLQGNLCSCRWSSWRSLRL
jgi:hypothetical protein